MTTNPTLDPHAPADPGPRGPLRDLRARVSGRLHTPEDPDWDVVRTPWRVNVAQSPLAVLDARDTHDVVAALRWAATHEVPVTAQTTGHGALERDGSSTADGALVVRCTGLTDIEVDLDRRSVWVGAGVRAGDLLAALDGSGYTYLSGSNPSPTVVGMTVTGGLSWFGRAFGSGADSIRTVELVDGLGRVGRVGPDARLGAAHQGAEHAELVGHGPGQPGDLVRGDVRGHPGAADRRADGGVVDDDHALKAGRHVRDEDDVLGTEAVHEREVESRHGKPP